MHNLIFKMSRSPRRVPAVRVSPVDNMPLGFQGPGIWQGGNAMDLLFTGSHSTVTIQEGDMDNFINRADVFKCISPATFILIVYQSRLVFGRCTV